MTSNRMPMPNLSHESANSMPYQKNQSRKVQVESSDCDGRELKTPRLVNILNGIGQLTDEEIVDNCFELAKDQSTCRLLQQKIEDDPEMAVELLLPKVLI